jgi:hypothetical protein
MNFALRAAESAQRETAATRTPATFPAEKMPVTHAAFVANDRIAP